MKKIGYFYDLGGFLSYYFFKTIEDSSRRKIGNVSSSGPVDDSSRRTKGYANDVIPKHAAIFFFFFFGKGIWPI